MRNIAEIKMENVSAASTSSVYTNTSCDLCSVQVYGTATAMKVQVQGMTDIDSETWVDLAVFNNSDLSLVEGDDGITEAGIYSAMVEGVTQIRIKVASVTGTLNVTAKLADTSAE